MDPGSRRVHESPPRGSRRSRERLSRLHVPAVAVCGFLLCVWLILYWVKLHGTAPPLWLATYDVVLALICVLMRALSSSKTGMLPFLHACSRKGGVRGFLSWLNLVQAIHLHVCANAESAPVRMLSAMLTTLPWWMDRRGGWTIVLHGPSTFGKSVQMQPRASVFSLLLSHFFHLHGLFNSLNLTCALSHFRDAVDHRAVVLLPEFRHYWWWLNVTTSADVLLQPLVQRRIIPHHVVPVMLALSMLPACCFAGSILFEHCSIHGAGASFLLWYSREDRAASNLALSLAFTQIFEVTSLLADRYSLVS